MIGCEKSSAEVERIIAAYRHYESSAQVQARWDTRNPGNTINLQRRTKLMHTMLAEHGLVPMRDKRILEIGCGNGLVLQTLQKSGADAGNLYGIDVRENAIEQGRQAFPDFQFEVGNAQKLHFRDHQFDLIVLVEVFSSILSETMTRSIVQEIGRVLKPGGRVLWHDMRYPNPWNQQVRPITKRKLKEYFVGFDIHLRSSTLIPQIARGLGPFTAQLYPLLNSIPLLRSHWLAVMTKQ